jgi:hypothetical protein
MTRTEALGGDTKLVRLTSIGKDGRPVMVVVIKYSGLQAGDVVDVQPISQQEKKTLEGLEDLEKKDPVNKP